MTTTRCPALALFVDRDTRQWIAVDRGGKYWVVAAQSDAWEHRRPFHPTDATDLKLIPGHYKHMLGLPF